MPVMTTRPTGHAPTFVTTGTARRQSGRGPCVRPPSRPPPAVPRAGLRLPRTRLRGSAPDRSRTERRSRRTRSIPAGSESFPPEGISRTKATRAPSTAAGTVMRKRSTMLPSQVRSPDRHRVGHRRRPRRSARLAEFARWSCFSIWETREVSQRAWNFGAFPRARGAPAPATTRPDTAGVAHRTTTSRPPASRLTERWRTYSSSYACRPLFGSGWQPCCGSPMAWRRSSATPRSAEDRRRAGRRVNTDKERSVSRRQGSHSGVRPH